MRAIRQHRFGGPEVLEVEDLPDLVPAEGQVRVAVEAAGVHLVDTLLRTGTPGPFGEVTLPTTPGREVAGTVDAAGPGVHSGWVGRRVTAHLGAAGGGYASQALAPVEALITLDTHVDASDAVALVGTGRTAVAILAEADLTLHDAVVIPAAAGGLGVLLVQAAKRAGAWVAGAAGGPDKVELVRQLGADVAVDYLQPGWDDEIRAAAGDRAITVALDGVGGEAGRAAFELVAPRGRAVLFGGSAGALTAVTTDDLLTRGVAVTVAIGPRLLTRPGGFHPLAIDAVRHLATGTWRPVVTRFPLDQAADAHLALTERRTTGKVVLLP